MLSLIQRQGAVQGLLICYTTALFFMLHLVSKGCAFSRSHLGGAVVVRIPVSYISNTRSGSRRWMTGRTPIFNESNMISSIKSQTVKRIQALQNKRKKRSEENLTIVEGKRMVFDLLGDPSTSRLVSQIFISEERWDEYAPMIDATDRFVTPVTSDVMRHCSDTVTPQGILAMVQIPRLEISISTEDNEKVNNPLFLVLDGVADPGNLGTLLRSARATGVAAVYLLSDSCCDPWNPKAVRSAMGTSFRIPIRGPFNDWDECSRDLSSLGCRSFYAATMLADIEGTPHFNVDWTGGSFSSALLIGSEADGLSEDVREEVLNGKIQSVYIPMETGVESLNAAVCGSVIMFEYQRQCMK